MKNHQFKSQDELDSNVIRRARAVLGMRNVQRPNDVKVCTNALRKLRGLEHSEDVLATAAIDIAEDTIHHAIEYFR